jgi:hypothetical protein
MRQLAEADRLISSPDHNRRRDRFRPRVTSGSNLANYGNILTSIDYVCSQTSSGAFRAWPLWVKYETDDFRQKPLDAALLSSTR